MKTLLIDLKTTSPQFNLAAEEYFFKKDTRDKLILWQNEPSVIIAQRPCALLKTVKYEGKYKVDSEKCRSCKMCMKLGCPAIVFENGKAKIDETQCNGCGLCVKVCPFNAIVKGE